jgi:hypothetical protein
MKKKFAFVLFLSCGLTGCQSVSERNWSSYQYHVDLNCNGAVPVVDQAVTNIGTSSLLISRNELPWADGKSAAKFSVKLTKDLESDAVYHFWREASVDVVLGPGESLSKRTKLSEIFPDLAATDGDRYILSWSQSNPFNTNRANFGVIQLNFPVCKIEAR